MFKINPDPVFTADVELSVPGKPGTVTVQITFKYQTKDQLIAFGEMVKDEPLDKALSHIIKGWEGFDVECTPENITLMLANHVRSGNEIITAYYRELYSSRVKN